MAAPNRTVVNFLLGFFSKKARSSSGIMKMLWLLFAMFLGGGGAFSYPYFKDVIWPKIVELARGRVRDRINDRRGGQGRAGSDTGAVKVYFTHPENPPQAGDIAHAVAGYVDATKQTLDVAAFELDNQVIVDALVRAARRGVRVRLVTDTDYVNESGVQALRAVQVPVVDDQRPGSLMHNKFMVFDNQAVWTGSMNFTENCAYRNNNHGVYIDDISLAANYAIKFSWMFEQRKFGSAPTRTARIPFPEITLVDGTPIENYFSTHDPCADRITRVVAGAKSSIHFLAFSFTHDGIGQEMIQRSQAGVEVAGVIEKSQSTGSYSEYARFHAIGLPVYTDANPRNMHHKVIVVDRKTVICGSFNFSANADKSNDENILIIHNRAVAEAFEAEFTRVYRAAGGVQTQPTSPVSWQGN